MPTKKTAKKKTPAAKKAPAKKATPKKKGVASKVVKKKTAVRKVTKKAAARKVVKNTVSKATAAPKPKASDFIKRPSHTPAIFKPPVKKASHILFSMEEIRDVLKKRAQEEKESAPKNLAKKKQAPVKKESMTIEEAAIHKSKHHAASLDDILGLTPSIGSKAGPGNVPRKHAKYHKLLIELRDQVRAELNLHSSDTLKRSQKDDAGDISTSVDAGTDNFDRDFALSLLSVEQESLNEIESAIQRIYKNCYGVCEVTGEPIKAERLLAVPYTRFSLEGQRQHESTRSRRVSQAGAFLNEASGETISFGDDDGDN